MTALAWLTAHTSVNGRPGGRPGWIPALGSSISAPLLAGIAADAAQLARHPLGVLGPALYRMHGPADPVRWRFLHSTRTLAKCL
jgi:hypothetical protein